MKPIEKVSIAGIMFSIDTDAYKVLKDYLDRLQAYYANDVDRKEILSDIEARIAELILSEQPSARVVEIALVRIIIARLGTPEDIEGQPEQPALSDHTEPAIPRRFYRSLDGRKIAGVCSGMSQYWNIDVTLIRLLFVCIPLVSVVAHAIFDNGFTAYLAPWACMVSIAVYLIFWIVTPVARTPRQKLEMRGEPITISSIHQGFQQEVVRPTLRSRKLASVMAEIFYVLGKIALLIIRIIACLIGLSVLAVALAGIVVFFVAIFSPSFLLGTPLFALPVWATMLGSLCLTIPLLLLSYALLSFVFNWKVTRTLYFILLGIWACVVIVLSIMLVTRAGSWNSKYELFWQKFLSDDHVVLSTEDYDQLVKDWHRMSKILEEMDQTSDNIHTIIISDPMTEIFYDGEEKNLLKKKNKLPQSLPDKVTVEMKVEQPVR